MRSTDLPGIIIVKAATCGARSTLPGTATGLGAPLGRLVAMERRYLQIWCDA